MKITKRIQNSNRHIAHEVNKHNRILYTNDHIVKRKTVIFQINNTKKKKEQNRNMADTTVKHKNIKTLLFLSDDVFVFVICPEYSLKMTTENIHGQ